jgi:thiamine biosynthesis lipoprotein
MSTDLAHRSSNSAPLVRSTLNGPTMGTRYSAVFFASEDTDTEALAAAVFEAVDRVDRQMSTWKKDSDLNRLNAAPVGNWVAIHENCAPCWRLRSESDEPQTARLTLVWVT